MDELPKYRYRGALVAVKLHERYMQKFLETWGMAKKSGVALPQTNDPNYASLDTLLRHVLWWAREYMIWICEMLKLPNPEIRPTPEADVIEAEAENYLEHLLQQWRKPLSQVSEDRFFKPQFTSRWKIDYCIDAMLEHAVMHPIRHRFQLKEVFKKNENVVIGKT